MFKGSYLFQPIILGIQPLVFGGVSHGHVGLWNPHVGFLQTWQGQVSNEKTHVHCLGYIGDEVLPSYVGNIVDHYRSLWNNQDSMESKASFFFFVAQVISILFTTSTNVPRISALLRMCARQNSLRFLQPMRSEEMDMLGATLGYPSIPVIYWILKKNSQDSIVANEGS